MTEQTPDHEPDRPGSPLGDDGGGDGIERTVGEPNTFEPEEDPDSVPEPGA
jgi:hypothetical protein